MKIEKVEVFGVAVPLIGEYKNAYLTKSVQKSVVVRITASGGVTGRGKFAPLLLGMDPTNVHAVLAKIEPAVRGFLDSKAAIEMACVDIAARVAGMPVDTYPGG